MNKVAIIISLILAMAVGLGGCSHITLQPALPSEPTITVIEAPSEAHTGEYVSVKVRVPQYDRYVLWLEELGREGSSAKEHCLGWAIPDSELIASWYSPLPTESEWWYNESFLPGSYTLIVAGEKLGESNMLRLNIIIKE